jgi:hypothetical protein
VRWVGPCIAADGSRSWGFYDCSDPAESNRIYIEVPEGCGPSSFKDAKVAAGLAVFMWEYLWKPDYHSAIELWEIGLQPPPEAQRQIADEVNGESAGKNVFVRAIGTHSLKSHPEFGTIWIFDCRSLVPYLPDLHVDIPAGSNASNYRAFEIIALTAVVEYAKRNNLISHCRPHPSGSYYRPEFPTQ